MLQTTSWAWPAFPVPAGVIPLGKARSLLPTRVLMSISPGGVTFLVYLTVKEAQRLLVKFVHALVDTRMPTAFEYHGSSDKIASPAGDLNPRGLQ